jgi:hypothetical protein
MVNSLFLGAMIQSTGYYERLLSIHVMKTLLKWVFPFEAIQAWEHISISLTYSNGTYKGGQNLEISTKGRTH